MAYLIHSIFKCKAMVNLKTATFMLYRIAVMVLIWESLFHQSQIFLSKVTFAEIIIIQQAQIGSWTTDQVDIQKNVKTISV